MQFRNSEIGGPVGKIGHLFRIHTRNGLILQFWNAHLSFCVRLPGGGQL